MDKAQKVNDRIRSGEIIEQKNWKFIMELNSCSEERLESIALADGKREYKYRLMFRMWERYARVFSAFGITEKNRSRAAMTGVPCSETIFAYYALNMTGASVSMVYEMDLNNEDVWKKIAREEHITDLILADCRTTPELLHRIMRERRSLGIRYVIVMHVPVCGSLMTREQEERAAENYRRLREFKGVLFMDDLLMKYEDHPISYGEDRSKDDAVIVHTSGTTKAVHKPVPMSDRGINESASRLLRDERFDKLKGTAVCCLFMNISLGYSFFEMMDLPLAFGGKIITLPVSDNPIDSFNGVIRSGANVLFAVPPLFENLVRLPFRPDFSKLEFVFMGAGYVSLDAKKRFDKFLKECGTDTKVSVGYGLTELGGVCLLSPEDSVSSMIGYPLPGVKVKIFDEDKEEYFDIEDGPRTGGLLLSSAAMSNGCLDGKEYFSLREIDGNLYLDTNDLVDVNEDGSLSFVGRTNRFFVNQEGRRFDAGLVETAVSKQPDIESCGIAPIHDKSVHDTVPALYVQLAGNVSRPEKVLKQALCKVYMDEDSIKETDLPVWCVITDRIPYNESGKVDVHKILTNEIGGKNYITEAVYTEGRLTDIKLIETDYPPGQMRPVPKKDRDTCFAMQRHRR